MTATKHQLDDKLRFFHELLVQMVNRVEEGLHMAIHAFRDKDADVAREVIANETIIEQMGDLIESDGVRLLISEAPYGSSMRQVIAGLKIVTSLQRMGDHAAHLAKIAMTRNDQSDYAQIIEGISDMALADAQMMRQAIEALVDANPTLAKEAASRDDDIDRRRSELNAMIFAQEPTTAQQREELYNCFYLVKELERLGDHVTTVCTWVVYMNEGVKPKLN